MDALVALALSIGVLIAGWTYVALGPGALPVCSVTTMPAIWLSSSARE